MKYVVITLLTVALILVAIFTVAVLELFSSTHNPLALIVGIVGLVSLYWAADRLLPRLMHRWWKITP